MRRRRCPHPLSGRIAPVSCARRILSVAAGVDDEMLAPNPLRDLGAVGYVDRSAEEIGDVEAESIGLGDAGAIEPVCHRRSIDPPRVSRIDVDSGALCL